MNSKNSSFTNPGEANIQHLITLKSTVIKESRHNWKNLYISFYIESD